MELCFNHHIFQKETETHILMNCVMANINHIQNVLNFGTIVIFTCYCPSQTNSEISKAILMLWICCGLSKCETC